MTVVLPAPPLLLATAIRTVPPPGTPTPATTSTRLSALVGAPICGRGLACAVAPVCARSHRGARAHKHSGTSAHVHSSAVSPAGRQALRIRTRDWPVGPAEPGEASRLSGGAPPRRPLRRSVPTP